MKRITILFCYEKNYNIIIYMFFLERRVPYVINEKKKNTLDRKSSKKRY